MLGTTNAVPVIVSREWRDGWPVIVASTAGVGLAAVPTYSLGVFIAPLSSAYGWSVEAIVLAQTLYSLGATFGAPLAGMLMDKAGARPLALAGCALLSASVAALSLTGGHLPLFYALWIVMAVAVSITSPMIWQKAIVDRFNVHRGLAVSVALCGSNIAGGIAPVLAAYLILNDGWQAAYLGLAAYMLVTAFPVAWFWFHDVRSLTLRSKGRDAALDPVTSTDAGMSPSAAARMPEFWILLGSFLFAGSGITGFIVHFVPLLTAHGVGMMLAASAVSVLSIAAIVGRLVGGWLMDRLFAPRLAAAALALPLLGVAVLFASPGYATGLFAAAMVGLSTGAEYNMISYLAVRYFGLRHYGSIAGYLNAAFILGCTAGPLVAAWSVASHGNYDFAVLWLGGSFGAASLLMLLCRRYAAVIQDQIA